MRLLVLSSVLLLALPAYSVDGVVEINQTSAVAGGLTPGDAPGFPVEVNAPGAYRLTSNLTLTDAATGAINVNSDDVDLDLNGFSILGPLNCAATIQNNLVTDVSCSPAPAGGYGVRASGQRRVTVHNGVVKGVGGTCIDVYQGLVHNVQVAECGGSGIRAADNSIVHDVRTYMNEGAGVNMGDGVVRSAVITMSGSSGLSAGAAVVSDVYVQWSRYHGIQLTYGGSVRDSSSVQNGWSGIFTNGQSLFLNNNIRHNDQWGIAGGPTQWSGYGGNVIWNNDDGSVGGAAMRALHDNVCGTDTDCSNDGP